MEDSIIAMVLEGFTCMRISLGPSLRKKGGPNLQFKVLLEIWFLVTDIQRLQGHILGGLKSGHVGVKRPAGHD
jgi:hypothetical protein